MKRKIIEIDEEKCNGCGLCIPDCPEGALQIIDEKARLVSDLFCDGLGACIGTCPQGAISVIERDAGAYDEKAVMDTIARQGDSVISAHLSHLLGHGQQDLYKLALEYLQEKGITVPEHHGLKGCQEKESPKDKNPNGAQWGPQADQMGNISMQKGLSPFHGCPGSFSRTIEKNPSHGEKKGKCESELRQWPIQLSLQNPANPFFEDADLLISADCVPFAYADFHRDFLKGKILIMFCPKLDADIQGYIEKLATIFSTHTIRSIMITHMEVPCCGGVQYVVTQALERSKSHIPVTDVTISIQGNHI